MERRSGFPAIEMAAWEEVPRGRPDLETKPHGARRRKRPTEASRSQEWCLMAQWGT